MSFSNFDWIFYGPVIFSYAQRRKRTVYYLSGSVLYGSAYYVYSPRNQTISCQYKLSKQTSAAHYRGTLGLVVLESKLNIGTRVLSQNKISVLLRVRVITALVL